MAIINSLIFLFVLSISALVLPSILPLTTFIGILLLIFGIILNLHQGLGFVDKKNKIDFLNQINYSNILNPVACLLLLFFLFFAHSFTEGFSFISGFATLVLHVLFLVYIINTRDHLLIYLKSYILLVLLMSIAGLTAIVLVALGLGDTSYVNISELTGGAFVRDTGSERSYLFPFKLGFILTNARLDLLGFNFYRISGWAHEPTSATLFVAPAMILLLHTKIIANSITKISMLAVISAFWFFAMSMGSLLAFIMLYSFYITATLFVKIFPLKLSLSIVIGLFIAFLFGSFYFEELINSTIVSKFDIQSQTFQAAIKRISWFIPEKAITQADSFSLLIIFAILFFFLSNAFYSFSVQKDFNVYALVVLYIVIHSMKGSQESVFVLIFSFFWFYVLYFSIPYKQTKSVKSFRNVKEQKEI